MGNKQSSPFIGLVFFFCPSDYRGQCKQLAFIQYGFDRQEHPIEAKPHGNSKGERPFCRCKPSVLKQMKGSVENKPPLQVLREVENLKGGVMNARSGCDLPRNRKQAYNFKFAVKHQPQGMSTYAKQHTHRTDVLAQVMLMCKESSGSQAYVRSVEAAPEPMCILTTDQQLSDMERFCTNDPFSVVSVDPTFNLGPFYVTPITYQNLLVQSGRGGHPIILGPVLIHQTKTFRPFHYFASTLIRLNPRLTNLRAFGTDGEPELIKAFSVAFPKAVHLRCVNHLRQNFKDKLHALNIPKDLWKELLADIFGVKTGSHFEMGLIDVQSEKSFWEALGRLQGRWNNLEMGCIQPGTEPQFHEWFCKYKAREIVECVLPKVRVKAGLKESCHFTTNTSESLNHVIKQEVEWKENKLPMLIEHLKSLTDQYNSELEKAVIGRGQWHFMPQYQHLEVLEISWFKMTPSSKERHMRNVYNCPVIATSPDLQATAGPPDLQATAGSPDLLANAGSPDLQATTGSPYVQGPAGSLDMACSSASYSDNVTKCPDPVLQRSDSSPTLEVAVEDCGITTISKTTLKNMWNKAERLICSDGSILRVPWNSDRKARLVMSSSSDHPHLIMTRKGKYSCDDKCMMFKGFSLCSHVIAAAHDNGDLHSLLENHRCSRHGPNLTAIGSQGMPSGSGRKGGVPKRKRNRVTLPIETRSVRQCLQESSDCTPSTRSSTSLVGYSSVSNPCGQVTTTDTPQGSLVTPSLDRPLTSTSVFGLQSQSNSFLSTVNSQAQTHPATACSSSFGPCQSPVGQSRVVARGCT